MHLFGFVVFGGAGDGPQAYARVFIKYSYQSYMPTLYLLFAGYTYYASVHIQIRHYDNKVPFHQSIYSSSSFLCLLNAYNQCTSQSTWGFIFSRNNSLNT